MTASLSKRIAVAVVSGGLAFGGLGLAPALAAHHMGGGGGHGGFHGGGGWHGGGGGWHGGHGYGYHGGWHHGYGYGYGGYGYGGYGYYGGPCIPVLGLVSGNYCGGYYY